MWMNLDALPANQTMYTAFVGDTDQDWDNPDSVFYDEYDFVAHVDITREGALRRAGEVGDLTDRREVLGVADQSQGGWVYLSENGRKLLAKKH